MINKFTKIGEDYSDEFVFVKLRLDEYVKLNEFNFNSKNRHFECLSCSYSKTGYGDFKRHKCKI